MRRRILRDLASCITLLLVGCQARPTGGLTAPSTSAATAAMAPSTGSENRMRASFVELGGAAAPVTATYCDDVFIAVARGHATVLGEELAQGDVLFAVGSASLEVNGTGLAVVALWSHVPCPPVTAPPVLVKRVARANSAPELAFAGGKMHAHLDLESDVSPNVYVGRLDGTAAVAEHTHPKSWEILCAVDGAGVFTLEGKPSRLAARSIVTVPPNTKHAWQPDDGSKLVAIQIYAPPGPEQRFRGRPAADTTTSGGPGQRCPGREPGRSQSAAQVFHDLPPGCPPGLHCRPDDPRDRTGAGTCQAISGVEPLP